MRTETFRIAFYAFAFVFFCTTASAESKNLPPAIAAVVDVQKILQDSLAAKNVQKQIDAQRAKFQLETEKEENALREAEQGLAKERDGLSTDVYTEHERQMRNRTLGIERNFEARRKMLDQGFADAKAVLSKTLQDITETVAHEHGATVIMLKQQILWADPTLDVTDEVLSRLNKKLPQINIKMQPIDKP